MVAVVQLVEHQVVILAVAGSSPVSHPEVEHRLTCTYAGEAVFVSRSTQRTMQLGTVIPHVRIEIAQWDSVVGATLTRPVAAGLPLAWKE